MSIHSKSQKILIVGAGIIGLTLAYRLKKKYPHLSITILEKERTVGFHASGRNSGVLHSGIYYGSQSLKAKVCAQGNQTMFDFAQEYGLPIKNSGKVIIPTNAEELMRLEHLMKNARENAIDAQLISKEEILEREPFAKPFKKGIYCPSVSVIDSKSVLKQLLDCLLEMDVSVEFNQEVSGVSCLERKVETLSGSSFGYDFLVNCGGAFADKVAKFYEKGQGYAIVPFKGLYYQLTDETSHYVHSSIYPVPDPDMPFLGVHFTRTVHDEVQIGPTATPALGRENYGVIQGAKFSEAAKIFTELAKLYLSRDDQFRSLVHREILNYWKPHYVKQAQKLVSKVRASDFKMSDKVGIRPQLVNQKTKELVMDFVVEETKDSLHVLNAISPAFTCSFAFADYLIEHMKDRLNV